MNKEYYKKYWLEKTKVKYGIPYHCLACDCDVVSYSQKKHEQTSKHLYNSITDETQRQLLYNEMQAKKIERKKITLLKRLNKTQAQIENLQSTIII